LEDMTKELAPLKQKKQALDSAIKAMTDNKTMAEEQFAIVDSRVYWSQTLSKFRDLLLDFEKSQTLGEGANVSHAGVWIEDFIPLLTRPTTASGGGAAAPQQVRFQSQMGAAQKAQQAYLGPSTVHYVDVTFRAVNLKQRAPAANDEFAFALQGAITANTELFVAAGTQLQGITPAEDTDLTFTFKIRIRLKDPVTVY